MATKNVVKTVMVVPPMASPDTGRMLSWTSTHTPDCPVARNGVYMPVSAGDSRTRRGPSPTSRRTCSGAADAAGADDDGW